MPALRLKLVAGTGGTAVIALLAARALDPVPAVAVSLLAAALIAWRLWSPLARRLRRLRTMARAYAAAGEPRWPAAHDDDDLGQLVRTMDETVQAQRQRLLELQRHDARLEAMLGEMAEGVLVVDRHGRVQLVNEVARRLLPGRVTPGDPYIDTVRHPGIVGELTGALRGARSDPLEVTLDEGRRSLAVHATPASEAAGGGAVLVLHDITALRTADRIRRDFVANVSHELRTPLTAVRGYIEALREEALENDERERFLEVVARHTDRMERLVGDLLRLARIEAGQERVEIVSCDTEALFQSVAGELATPIRARRLTLDVRVAGEATRVPCDLPKLHDALRNLMENAVHYSPEGGRIALDARREGDRIALSIGDEGPGIPEGELPRVFERFYRVDKSRTRDPGGTGLGLSIVKHLVELHQGRVVVQNREPHGALFTILLPAEPQTRPRVQ